MSALPSHTPPPATSLTLHRFPSWEQEQSRRRRKWRAEKRKERVNKDESEKDSDSSESPPDTTESQEVAVARESLLTLMTEQTKILNQKVGFPAVEKLSLRVPP